MQKSYWKTGSAANRRAEVNWPTAGQIARQIGLVAVIVLVWGAAFWGFVQFAGPAESEVAQSSPAEVVAAEPTAADTATPEPTATSTSTATPTATPTVLAVTEQPGVTTDSGSESTAPPTETSTPEPTPTETPVPPTETPVPPTETLVPEAGGVSFSAEVLPIFENRCTKCHGGEDTEEGLDLTNHASTLAGGWNGTVIEPGDVEGSYLIEQIVSGEMPDKEPRLLPAEIRIISAWVEAGAPNN
jgi:hypothetical protein